MSLDYQNTYSSHDILKLLLIFWVNGPKNSRLSMMSYAEHRWTASDIKSVPFGHKWTISAPGITINNPEATLLRTSINLVTKRIYNPGIVKCKKILFLLPMTGKKCTGVGIFLVAWDTYIVVNLVDLSNKKSVFLVNKLDDFHFWKFEFYSILWIQNQQTEILSRNDEWGHTHDKICDRWNHHHTWAWG